MWIVIGGVALVAIVTALAVTAIWVYSTDPRGNDHGG